MKRNKAPFIVKYFLSVIIISFIISLSAIIVANDVFAFIKKDEPVTLEIPEGADTVKIADILFKNGLIISPYTYRLYSRLRGDYGEYLSGEFTLDKSMSYDELRYSLKPGKKKRQQIKITIPEGYTTDEIIDMLVSLGVGTRAGYEDAINNGDFGYDFIKEIPENANRKYRLEGYLFPDTYYIYSDSTEKEAVSRLLDNFNRKYNSEIKEKAEELGYTMDEIVTLASIIEEEAYFKSDMPGISSVFRNRLKSKKYKYLESDATVQYALQLAGIGRHESLSREDLKINSPYNTYEYTGLPPGAVCNPGIDAIEAAISPSVTDYYYFVSAKNKTTVFSHTYEEHMRAVAGIS